MEAVASTNGLGTPLDEDGILGTVDTAAQEATGNPAGEPLFGLQWDMTQIHTPEANAVTTGSPNIVVGVLDSGISSTHPDLATQIAKDKSASCLGGVVNTAEAAWNPPPPATARTSRARSQLRSTASASPVWPRA